MKCKKFLSYRIQNNWILLRVLHWINVPFFRIKCIDWTGLMCHKSEFAFLKVRPKRRLSLSYIYIILSDQTVTTAFHIEEKKYLEFNFNPNVTFWWIIIFKIQNKIFPAFFDWIVHTHLKPQFHFVSNTNISALMLPVCL